MHSKWGQRKSGLLGLGLGIISIIGLIIFFGIHYIKNSSHQTPELTPPVSQLEPPLQQKSGACASHIEASTMQDTYLPGVVEQGRKIQVIWDYYRCHPPRRGEIAMVRLSRDLPPRAKVIRAVPGDRPIIRPDAGQERWNILINQQLILDFKSQPYAFGGKPLPPIGRYLQFHNGLVGERDVIALSTRSPGEMDSGLFGPIGIDDLLAKVELK